LNVSDCVIDVNEVAPIVVVQLIRATASRSRSLGAGC
jgi:hypothetical protein